MISDKTLVPENERKVFQMRRISIDRFETIVDSLNKKVVKHIEIKPITLHIMKHISSYHIEIWTIYSIDRKSITKYRVDIWNFETDVDRVEAIIEDGIKGNSEIEFNIKPIGFEFFIEC